MKTNILYFAFLSLFLTSCSQKWCNTRYPASVDSIYIETIRDSIVIKDTTIYIKIKGETRIDSVIIPCPDPGPAYVPDTVRAEVPLAIAKAWFKWPTIKLILIQKDTTIEQRLDNAVRESYHWKSLYEKMTVRPQPVKYIPGIYKIALWLWIGVVVAIAGYIAVRLFVLK